MLSKNKTEKRTLQDPIFGEIEEDKLKRKRMGRKVKDFFSAGSTYLFSSFSIIALVAIIVFIFSKGWSTLTWDFFTGDYQSTVYTVKTSSSITRTENTFDYECEEGEYFSSNWGIAFTDSTDNEGNAAIEISYVDANANINNWVNSADDSAFSLKTGTLINSVLLWTTSDVNTASVVLIGNGDTAETAAAKFDRCEYLSSMTLTEGGLGMRGSLITTLWMILLTMVIALPLGIIAAIYLAVFAKQNKLTKILQQLIDMISGIPSIIFGLVGGMIFVPMFGGSTSILAGACTLACMVLPLIIKTTQEAIKTIPSSIPNASYALGASDTQTTFKLIIPNAMPGILTSALLAIGRVIGESAALIYTSGTAIMDYIIPTQGSSTLAVHIWKLMSGENANYECACAVAIVILFLILILSAIVKLLSIYTNRYKKKG